MKLTRTLIHQTKNIWIERYFKLWMYPSTHQRIIEIQFNKEMQDVCYIYFTLWILDEVSNKHNWAFKYCVTIIIVRKITDLSILINSMLLIKKVQLLSTNHMDWIKEN